MRVIELNTGGGESRIFIGESIKNISKYIPENTIVITDKNVDKLYGKYFEKYPVIEIEQGESSKSFRTIEKICKELIKFNADRSTFLLGVGGGVVTDITGFVASIFKRDLRFGYVSTTLLGQVDASIGGKNGINFEGFKNVIGTLRQPEFIISDFTTLNTLPKREIINGMAELIKTSLIADKQLFNLIEEKYFQVLNLDDEILEDLIFTSAKIKINIVQKDEKENGVRRTLNFGHTLGHAIESTTDLSHGKAIGIGMLKALQISVDKVNLKNHIVSKVETLLKNCGLPISVKYDIAKVEKAIIADKKKYNDKIKFVLLEDIGKPVIKDIPLKELKEYL